jgi:prophage DNA circulation protein
MKKQNDAVFAAVCLVLNAQSFDEAVKLDSHQRKEVVDIVAKGIFNKEVDFSDEAWEKHNTFEKIRSYTVGMVSNHLRKDKRLNGGEKYEIKNPGSRASQGDAVLKNMKALRATLTDPEQIQAVDDAIANREAELKAEKAKTVTIDIDKIPEELRHLIPA